ncbi:hypothetical protein ACFQBQ_18485 [Granulicella cerasi]|uniref:Prenyltransferase n=1 Tax=Granulicella cerasi TaxID=741063 RepID=A0ABW1ZF55_9BACT|nr:hypothetical protein [Granulicella cerasi]
MQNTAKKQELDVRRGLRLVPAPPQRQNSLTLWHLLSLDAPSVAAVWTVLVARATGVHLAWPVPAAMFVAVWLVYVADRLLDRHDLEERHRFHQRHRARFVIATAWAVPVLAALVFHFDERTLRLNLLLASLLVAWFVIIHASAASRRLPKELAVGIFFPAAVFLPTVALRPDLRLELIAPAILFAMLCTLNCLFVYAWEHPHDRTQAHATTRWALEHLDALSFALMALAAVFTLVYREDLRVLPVCIGLGAGFLLLLDRLRATQRPTVQRALADAALLTPLLFLPFLR